MADNSQDLVIRLKTNSQNFNEGIDKAKGKVKSFKTESEEAGNSTAKSFAVLKGAIGKVAIAIGAATTAWKAYKSMAEQTQYYGDKLNNTFSAFKDTWDQKKQNLDELRGLEKLEKENSTSMVENFPYPLPLFLGNIMWR